MILSLVKKGTPFFQNIIFPFCWQFSRGLEYFNFTPSLTSLLLNRSRTRIMETCWCCKKNSMVNWINHGIDFTSEVVLCNGSGCPEWKKWESRRGCHHVIKQEKNSRR